ncbi:T9SS type A sorting domain-containing protein [Spirosoma jeollabukense]
MSAPATYFSYKNLGIIGLTNPTVQSDQSSVAASTGSGASTDGIDYQHRHPEDFVHLNENPSYQGLTALANSWQNALGSSGYGVAAQTMPSVSLQYNSSAGTFTAYAPSGYSDYKWVNGNGDLDNGTGGGSSAYSAVLGTGMRCWVKNGNGNWSLTPMVYPQSCTSGARKAAIGEPGEADFGYKLSIFPNPSSIQTTVQFEIPYPANVEVDFIDVTGQVKQTVAKNRHDKGAFTYPVNIASLPAGIYYCRLKAGDVSIIKKMVVGGK